MNVLRVAVDDVPMRQWQALNWAVSEQARMNGFVALFTNNGIAYVNDPFPNRLFVGAKRVISLSDGPNTFQALYAAHQERPSYLVGYVGYDVKNQLETLTSRNPDRLGFPDSYFVEPEWIVDFEQDSILVQSYNDPATFVEQMAAYAKPSVPTPLPFARNPVHCRVTPEEYQANVRRIQEYIRSGDVYELNYCLEFFAENAYLDPLETYRMLNARSPMPFSTFFKLGERYIIGASPERFIKKEGNRIWSQPIKGTIRRGQTPREDQLLRAQLLNSEKERAENLMIVDLVRNDLARSAKTGSVQVDELFGIYGFQQVYQMISTVSAALRDDVTWAEALQNAFPMGSMTGALKFGRWN